MAELDRTQETDLTTAVDAPSPRRRARRLLVLLTILLAAVIAAGVAYSVYFQHRALPGTSVAGQSVTGKTHAEIVSDVEGRAQSVTYSVEGAATAEGASPADLGITVDAQKTADDALAANDSWFSPIAHLFSRTDVPAAATADAGTLEAYASGLLSDSGDAFQNAAVTLDEDGSSFSVTPERAGVEVDMDDLSRQLEDAKASLEPVSLKVTTREAQPDVTDDMAQKAADLANDLVDNDVTIEIKGVTDPVATPEDVASWLTFDPSDDGSQLTVGTDAGKVKEWVQAAADEAGTEPVTGVQNVDSAGEVKATPVEAVDGQAASNVDDVVGSIQDALASDQDFSGGFEFAPVTAEWTQRPVAAGAEGLAYAPAEGEKWIDVNLTDHTYTAYEGTKVVRGPVDMVHGSNALPTATGTYAIYLKYDQQTMKGRNADGSNYVTEDVPWVSYWYRGYAFHGAPWRSSFGYAGSRGSHGCVNLPVSEAKWIYDWGEIGTVVVSHK